MDQISPCLLNFQQIKEAKKPSAQIVQAELKSIFDNFMKNSSNAKVAVDTIKALVSEISIYDLNIILKNY